MLPIVQANLIHIHFVNGLDSLLFLQLSHRVATAIIQIYMIMVILVVYLIMESYCLMQLLDDVCTKNGWGTPSYSLHSTGSLTGASHSELQLFLYNIKIPAINIPFQPTKLSTNVDEAQRIAVNMQLMQLIGPFIKLRTYH